MGSKLKVLSGKDVVSILNSFDFSIFKQKRSHIKVKRTSRNGVEILIVPNHTQIAKGTLKSIFNQASKYISTKELYPHFYTE